jgi:hypothetical protein
MKNLLSENMLRFGTKNLSEAQKQKLSEQSADPAELKASGMSGHDIKRVGVIDKQLGIGQKYEGIAMKIVGLLMKAMGGFTMSSGVTDEQGILKAIYMIKNKATYDAVLREVQVGAAVKKEYGKNYSTIGALISTDLTSPAANSFRDAMSNDYNTVYEIERHLKQFNKNEKVEAVKGLHGSSADERDFRGSRSRRPRVPGADIDNTPDDAGSVMRF